MSLKYANDGRSASIQQDIRGIVEAHESIRPLRDVLVVEPLPVEHSQVLAVVEFKRPLRGIVRAVGPGHYPKRYDHPDKHRRTKMWDSPVFQPTQCKVGDIVELGMVGGDGYAFPQILWGGKIHIIVREADVSGICEYEADEVTDFALKLQTFIGQEAA